MMTDRPTILYVEDDAHSRRLMSMLLHGRMQLAHVTLLEDSRDFVARVAALTPAPDLILLDIHVQPLSGFEMLALLRQMPAFARTPIVALTASVMSEEVQKLRAAGFDSCLAKPIDLETFPELLRRILAGETIWSILQ
jgi:CheY-like chemotaxis protein